MRTILHVERRRAPRRPATVMPRDSRRARLTRRQGLRSACGYQRSVSFSYL